MSSLNPQRRRPLPLPPARSACRGSFPPFLSCADSADADVSGEPDLLKPKSEHNASDSPDPPASAPPPIQAFLELSRRVVEVILFSSWAPGEVETVFRVQNPHRGLPRRGTVQGRPARRRSLRRETMRFYCRRPSASMGDSRGSARHARPTEAGGGRCWCDCRPVQAAESEPEWAGESVGEFREEGGASGL